MCRIFTKGVVQWGDFVISKKHFLVINRKKKEKKTKG